MFAKQTNQTSDISNKDTATPTETETKTETETETETDGQQQLKQKQKLIKNLKQNSKAKM